MYRCQVCNNTYVWHQSLKRHVKQNHQSNQQQQQQQMQKQQQQQREQQEEPQFSFQHPFTCIISGPTSSGKTYFLCQLLQRAGEKIRPPPERIIWIYKRWQPLYDVIQRTVYPKVEFMSSIPWNLETDHFLNPKVKNVIVLDDMATEAAKDPRVTDLFTEGSHHRNLSVIALNQNFYFNKDPTQRRNCHYLVLFNNPVDKQQIMTLAKQMYPTNPTILIRNFKEAVKHPYGYLLIDLKPTTSDTLRMRRHIFEDDPRIPSDPEPAVAYSYDQNPSFQVTDTPQPRFRLQQSENAQSTRQFALAVASCDDCGTLFSDIHYLQKDVKWHCPEVKDKPSEHRANSKLDWIPDEDPFEDGQSDDEDQTEDNDESSGSKIDDPSVESQSEDDDDTADMDGIAGGSDPVMANSDVKKWKRHFQSMAEGKIMPSQNGSFVVETLQDDDWKPPSQTAIKFVTPVERDLALARSQLNIKEKKENPAIRLLTHIDQEAKRAKAQHRVTKRKNPYDVFDMPTHERKRDFSMRPPGIPYNE